MISWEAFWFVYSKPGADRNSSGGIAWTTWGLPYA